MFIKIKQRQNIFKISILSSFKHTLKVFFSFIADKTPAKRYFLFFGVSLHPNVHSLSYLRLRMVENIQLLDHSMFLEKHNNLNTENF